VIGGKIQNVIEAAAISTEQLKQVYSTKHLSARIVFRAEEVLFGRVMVFLSLVSGVARNF